MPNLPQESQPGSRPEVLHPTSCDSILGKPALTAAAIALETQLVTPDPISNIAAIRLKPECAITAIAGFNMGNANLIRFAESTPNEHLARRVLQLYNHDDVRFVTGEDGSTHLDTNATKLTLSGLKTIAKANDSSKKDQDETIARNAKTLMDEITKVWMFYFPDVDIVTNTLEHDFGIEN